jgi:succinate dehydrogenase/fumarate reductase flavoprotein subunit
MQTDYDVIVVGAGGAGCAAVLAATEQDARLACVPFLRSVQQ